MLTRWRTFDDLQGEMTRLHDEMNRLFDRWATGGGSRLSALGAYPAVNVWESDESYCVEAELPGFELDDLEIHVTGDNQLSIKGERKTPELQGGVWHRQERGYGSFARVMELPSLVDAEKVVAELKHGVLTITLPKREEAKPHRIEVKVN